MQQLVTDEEAHLFTYKSFVSSLEKMEELLGGNFDEGIISEDEDFKEFKFVEITSDGGVIQKMLLNTLLDHSIASEDGFYVYLNS